MPCLLLQTCEGAEGVAGREILPMDQYRWAVSLPQAGHYLIQERIVFGSSQPLLTEADIQWILPDLFRVAANIHRDWKDLVRLHPSCSVDNRFACSHCHHNSMLGRSHKSTHSILAPAHILWSSFLQSSSWHFDGISQLGGWPEQEMFVLGIQCGTCTGQFLGFQLPYAITCESLKSCTI